MPLLSFPVRVVAGREIPSAAVRALESALRRRAPKGDAAPAPGSELLLAFDPALRGQDAYTVTRTDTGLRLSAGRPRGFFYAVGRVLREADSTDEGLTFPDEACGPYAPAKPIRGHQIGCRPLSNTYDKWDMPTFTAYLTELMLFGINTVELIPLGEQNELMAHSAVETACLCSRAAQDLDLEVSVWIPNGDADEDAELAEREDLFARIPRLDAVFIPGADPGDLPAGDMIVRAVKIGALARRYHPDVQLWVSAQAPHDDKHWGEDFLTAVHREKEHFAGVIQGPNRAFDLPELRRRLDASLPIRYYPDICHTLRCEYPLRDVWYGYQNGLGRESVCPRPVDYKALHTAVSPYTVGSVTYSDGVNDDVNKAVFAALEWDPTLTPEAIAVEYARCYIPEAAPERIAAGILSLERAYHRSPADPKNDFALYALSDGGDGNWRLNSLRFLALCQKHLRETWLSETAACAAYAGGPLTKGPAGETRRALDALAGTLYEQIGMQLDVGRYHAYGVERGATLETIDLPVTDLQRLSFVYHTALSRGEDPAAALSRERAANTQPENGRFVSLSLHGVAALGAEQPGDYYLNVLGDRPGINNGSLPMRLACAFDHYTLDLCFRELAPGNYTLTLTVYRLPEHFFRNHTVTCGGNDAGRFTLCEADPYLPPDFCRLRLHVPATMIEDGALRLHIEEPETGFQTAALRLERIE